MLATLRTSLFDTDSAAAADRLGLFGFGSNEESPADQFASWLPYVSYLDDEQLFVNADGIGFMLEVMPQSGADDRMVEVLISLYANCPPAAGVQFHLFASPHIRPQLRKYANLRMEDDDQLEKAQVWGRPARNDNLFRKLARRRFEHLTAGAQRSLTQGFHYTIRDFRLMMSVTLQGDPASLARRDEIVSLRDGMATTLRSASLPNRVCDAADLINWCSLFVNPDRITDTNSPDLHYDNGREIRDQIVDFDTIQDPHPANALTFVEGRRPRDVLDVRASTRSSRFPERFALWQTGSLIGDLMQPALQYTAPFLLTMGVHVLDPNVTRSRSSPRTTCARRRTPSSKMADRDARRGQEGCSDWTAAAEAIDTGGSAGQPVPPARHLFSRTGPRSGRPTRPPTRSGAGAWLPAQRRHLHAPAGAAGQPADDAVGALPPRPGGRCAAISRKTMANAIHLAPLDRRMARHAHTGAAVFGGRRGQLMTLDLSTTTTWATTTSRSSARRARASRC